LLCARRQIHCQAIPLAFGPCSPTTYQWSRVPMEVVRTQVRYCCHRGPTHHSSGPGEKPRRALNSDVRALCAAWDRPVRHSRFVFSVPQLAPLSPSTAEASLVSQTPPRIVCVCSLFQPFCSFAPAPCFGHSFATCLLRVTAKQYAYDIPYQGAPAHHDRQAL